MGQSKSTTGPFRVCILNQYFVPDVASTGHLLAELAEQLAKSGVLTSVLTCKPSYGPPETWQPAASYEISRGVEITRLWTPRLSKDRLAGRLLNSSVFLLQLLFRLVIRPQRENEVFLYTTNPPYLGVIGAIVSLIRRHRYVVLLHDAYPQLAVWCGKISAGNVLTRLWHWTNRFTYRRAQETIVLCDAARQLVCRTYGIDPERVHVVHNWADGEALHPVPKASSPFAIANGLVEPFTLLYSGNLGLYYDFEAILTAAGELRNEPFRLVFIGAGARRAHIADSIAHLKLSNASLHPYRPFTELNSSLNACDASLVTIAREIEGISFPSKLYASLAVGKPIVALSEPDSELRRIVEAHQVGIWAAIDDTPGLIAGLRRLMSDPVLCQEMGRRARALIESSFSLSAASRAYEDILRRANRA